MPTFGFAIDLRKCIGCHACTIACKAEHDIPVGVNRCWVKTVEEGEFPATRRLFFPALCNQCDNAPCATICPTGALFRRPDGIVDLRGDSCIGCRACMAACPYDQLFIDPNTRTAEKCNFCANRLDNGLLPACVIVCPTECRTLADLDDPASEVSRISRREGTAVRKPEKGTLPKVFYLGAEASVLVPEVAARPFMFKEGRVRRRPLASPSPDPMRPGDARVDYDAPHERAWGLDMAVYLLTKGVSTGAMLLSALLWIFGVRTPLTTLVGPGIALVFAVLTAVVLVLDLERPARFSYIVVRSNRRSWIVWGAYWLTAHGVVAGAWVAANWLGLGTFVAWLAGPAVVVSVVATSYTGFLFAQGLARDLWQGPRAVLNLLAQAVAEGSAAMLLVEVLRSLVTGTATPSPALEWALLGSLVVHLGLLWGEVLLAPGATRHRVLAVSAIRRGPFARLFWGGALTGSALAVLAIAVDVAAPGSGGWLLPFGSVGALVGGFTWEYIWVEAGQSVPLS